MSTMELLRGSIFERKLLEAVAVRQTNSDVRRGDYIIITTNEYCKKTTYKKLRLMPLSNQRDVPKPKIPMKREARVIDLNFILLLMFGVLLLSE